MKKYFVTETDEICNFGDSLHLTFFKDIENGKVTVEKDIEFNEGTMDWMIEMGFVKERGVEDEEDDGLIHFDDNCPHEDLLQEICEDQEAMEKRLNELEKFVQGMYKELKKMIELEIQKEKKTAKPQKK